jgi:hypothetical protein
MGDAEHNIHILYLHLYICIYDIILQTVMEFYNKAYIKTKKCILTKYLDDS